MRWRTVFIAVVVLAALLLPTGSAASSRKKAIWGPVEVDGVSQFPIYQDLGVGIFQHALSWPAVARTRPLDARDPSDPAYRWPTEVDRAVAEARSRHMRVSLLLNQAPSWANGGHEGNWAPTRPRDMANFAVAAARRYPGVHHWMIWGEPSKASRFQPLVKATGRHLSRRQKQARASMRACSTLLTVL
jgi:hypothetical protein